MSPRLSPGMSRALSPSPVAHPPKGAATGGARRRHPPIPIRRDSTTAADATAPEGGVR
jgi:hypothetical protein